MTDADFIAMAVELLRASEHTQSADQPDYLFAAVSGAKSRDLQDLAHKLALWRLNASHLKVLDHTTSLDDRLLYSAYRDALTLSGLTNLATADDVANDFFGDVLTDTRAA